MLVITNPDKPNALPKRLGSRAETVIRKMISDKKNIKEYIKQGKDLAELAKTQNISLEKPL